MQTLGRAALMCAYLLAPLAGADGPHWLKVTSPNFELFTTAGERSGREVVQYFEQVRSFFQQAVGFGSNSGAPVRIVVFRSDKEYAPYAPNEFASAFYLGTDDRDYVIMKSAAVEHFPVAVHEYTHLLVKHTGVKVPIWFNEGLAEFYSNLKPLAGKVVVGSVIPPHYLQLRQSKWIDLGTLLAVGYDSPLYNEKSHAGLFYSESWALVHMLYLGRDYRGNLRALLEGIKSGANMADTFQKAYGKSVSQVQKDLEAYMGATSFDASIFNTKIPDKVDRPDVAESSPQEAGLVLAEVQSNMRAKAAEAREMYERLARNDPKDWRIEEGLARLSRRERKNEEAMAHYARAVELGSTNARMYLDYGRLLRFHEKHAEAVAVLKRATEIEPDNQEARLELGLACVVNEQYAEALKQLLLVKRVKPEQAFGYFHAMAYAYYRLDKKAEGKAAAANCRQYAKRPDEIDRLNQLVEALNYERPAPAIMEHAPALTADDPPRPPPKLKRRPEWPVAEGTLKQIDCAGGKIRVQITIDGAGVWFAVDPAHVSVKNQAGMDFTCGPQRPRKIRVEFSVPDLVRTIEFP